MPAVEAVFFDLGDTISDLREGQDDYMQRVNQRANHVYETLIAAGVTMPDRDAFCAYLSADTERRYLAAQAQLRSLTIYEAMRAVLGDAGLPTDDGLVTAAGDAYCTGAKTPMQLRPGARETLTALSDAGLRLGVISNTIQPGRFMDASLMRQGLIGFFPARAYSSEAGVPKPHPRDFPAGAGRPGRIAGARGSRGRPAGSRRAGRAGCRDARRPDRSGAAPRTERSHHAGRSHP